MIPPATREGSMVLSHLPTRMSALRDCLVRFAASIDRRPVSVDGFAVTVEGTFRQCDWFGRQRGRMSVQHRYLTLEHCGMRRQIEWVVGENRSLVWQHRWASE